MTNTKAPQPVVSIIMPFYRQDEYLIEAVKSIQSQTYENWELIVVDDASDGRSAAELLAKTAGSNCTILRHAQNAGVSAAKNTGAANAKGDLFLPVDSDDMLAPEYLERAVSLLCDSNADGVYTDFEMFGTENLVSCTKTSAVRILSGWFPPNPVLMKREVFTAVGGYDTDFSLGEDACFWVTAHTLGKSFVHLHEPLYLYRRHEASGTLTRGREYPLILTKLVRKFPRLYRDNMEEIVDLLSAHWIEDVDTHKNLLTSFQTLEKEYLHLHREFHALLSHVESRHQQPVSIRETALTLLKEIGNRLSDRSLFSMHPAERRR